MEWTRHPSKRSEDLPKCTSSSPRHKSYFLLSRTHTNIRLWWIGQSNNGETLIQNWYKDISLVTIWSRSSRGCWQEAFWHSLQAIWGALIESAATISQQWISALKEVAGVGCGESGSSVCSDWNKEFHSLKWWVLMWSSDTKIWGSASGIHRWFVTTVTF